MALCGKCSRPVVWREVNGVRKPFDLYDVTRGEGRYVELQDGTMRPVKADADVMAAQLHEQTCGVGHR